MSLLLDYSHIINILNISQNEQPMFYAHILITNKAIAGIFALHFQITENALCSLTKSSVNLLATNNPWIHLFMLHLLNTYCTSTNNGPFCCRSRTHKFDAKLAWNIWYIAEICIQKILQNTRGSLQNNHFLCVRWQLSFHRYERTTIL